MAAAALKILERQLARRLGADGVHRRVYLHARRDADGDSLITEGCKNIARGAVAARKKQEVCILHRLRGAFGVVRGRLRPGLIHAFDMGEA